MKDWLEQLDRGIRIVLSRLECKELASVLVRSEESTSSRGLACLEDHPEVER
jgi:hypothetical protein